MLSAEHSGISTNGTAPLVILYCLVSQYNYFTLQFIGQFTTCAAGKLRDTKKCTDIAYITYFHRPY